MKEQLQKVNKEEKEESDSEKEKIELSDILLDDKQIVNDMKNVDIT